MRAEVQAQLLALNQAFYATVAGDFDQTRSAVPAGMAQVVQRSAPQLGNVDCAILDVGCGNGRFAWALEQANVAADYVGVDNDSHLLQRAREHAATLTHVRTVFVQADLAGAGWGESVPATRRCDLVVCLATLQHFPAYELRRQLLAEMASRLALDGRLVISGWQFLDAVRFRQKQLAWETLGLHEQDVEQGDALLPWNQGCYAVRFVHQIDRTEMSRLAADTGLTITESFRADGKEGDLNLYVIMKAG